MRTGRCVRIIHAHTSSCPLKCLSCGHDILLQPRVKLFAHLNVLSRHNVVSQDTKLSSHCNITHLRQLLLPGQSRIMLERDPVHLVSDLVLFALCFCMASNRLVLSLGSEVSFVNTTPPEKRAGLAFCAPCPSFSVRARSLKAFVAGLLELKRPISLVC